MIRDDIKTALVTAMKGGDKAATGTIRLIQSAIKNRDIELRTSSATPDDDLLITEVLQKMIKQRRESAEVYRKGGREDRAAVEEGEIAVIERFLPKQMSDGEAQAAEYRHDDGTGAARLSLNERGWRWVHGRAGEIASGSWVDESATALPEVNLAVTASAMRSALT